MTIQNLRSRGLETKISLVLSNFSYLRGNGVTGGVLGGLGFVEKDNICVYIYIYIYIYYLYVFLSLSMYIYIYSIYIYICMFIYIYI